MSSPEDSPGSGVDLPDDPREGYDETRDGPPKEGGKGQQQAWPGSTEAMSPRPDHGEESYRGSGRLEGKRALVTGGDSGIGRAVAIAFAREGADVVIAYYDEADDAADTVRWIEKAGRRARAVEADLVSRDECRRVVAEAVEELGGLDVVVSNAAYQCERSGIEELTEEQVDRTVRTNLHASIWIAQAALEHLEAGGVVLYTGSVTALEGNDGLIDYASTKGAIHTLTKSLARSVAERGIRVNCVAPGPVWTPLIPSTLEEGHVAAFGSDTFWKRPAQPVEIAPSYVFLASDDGRYYSGEILAPTGKTSSR